MLDACVALALLSVYLVSFAYLVSQDRQPRDYAAWGG